MRSVMMAGLLAACSRQAPTPDPEPEPEVVCVDEVPYDGIDQDCDGADRTDVDRDGHDALAVGGADCDDLDPDRNPDAVDVPYDGIDQDCVDGDVVDADGDGEAGIVAGGTDCDDADPETHPGAVDTAGNDVDNDCDGIDGVDGDGDGFASAASEGPDCDDDDDAVHPDATEVWYDGLDQDCDRRCDHDQDGDGHVLDGTLVVNATPCDVVPGIEAWAPVDCDELDPQATDVEVDHTEPADGEMEVAGDVVVRVALSEPDPAPTLSLVDPDGAGIPGTLTVVGGDDLTFVPDVPLAAGTAYEVEVTHGCGTERWSFVTAYEVLHVDPAALVGRAWSVQLATGEVVEPAGLAGFMAWYVSDPLVIAVLGAGVDHLDLRLADGTGSLQDLCAPTVDTTADFGANPELAFGPVDWPYHMDLTYDLLEVVFSGGVRAGGEVLADIELRTMLDTRPLVQPILGVGLPPDALCVMSAGLGDPCVDCPDGTGTYCLPIRVEGAIAAPFEGTVAPRTQEEIDADPACP